MSTTTHETINLDTIVYDSRVQRREGTDERRVGRMVACFNPAAVGMLVASRRADGTIVILDGAHRAAAMRAVGIKVASAIVHHGLTVEDEARMFVQLNTFMAPSAVSRFLARSVAGDADAVDIVRLLAKHGWRVMANADKGAVTCPGALERIYADCAGTKKKGAYPADMEWVLDVIAAAWDDEFTATTQNILLGLAMLRGRFGNAVDAKRLAHELSFHRPATLIARAKALRDAQGGTVPAAMAKIVAGIYNNKKRTGLLPEWVWVR